ncbi:MAG: hypothetical protein A2927_00735 [Candidatus Komeilibacteria bacterium RIFCSPLOWO2_01_FULL_45_10]|uniref:Glycosyltransferase subfamily 4-like N-terminal domain-containing protein n=1 Tax=Candidatus Komeilibacteria bacterium RIFCSPLOWO2_01_FULL_45_10 TaxID=1798550 RepID=A0A1G2BJI2_9BACT|nr:MAG: hypothetical protein A2927_00735 [Candidatus Komeilibacteria bacterium RIFCSPLOWO2_01_FULL_45_10]
MANLSKKIIYLITQSEWGGAQEYLFNLATNIDKNQYDCLVLSGEGNGELFKELNQANVRYQKLKYTKRAVNPLFDFLALWELIKIFKKERPDIIHLNSSKIGFLGSLAGQIYKLITNNQLLITYTAHGWVFNEPLNWLVKKLYFWIEKISAKWKDAIICVSEADRQIALKHNFKSKIVTIHNAVNYSQLNFLEKELARQELIKKTPPERSYKLQATSYKLIGTIANLYPTKGINYLIGAAALLLKERSDLIFAVIGDGAERQNLESLIANRGLTNNFFLLGSIPNAHRLLKGFDLFVLPSVKEGLPYAVLKAQAAGIPIVATKVGGVPEIIDEQCLVEPKNPQTLAKKIKEVINQPTLSFNHPTDFKEFLNKTFNLYH